MINKSTLIIDAIVEKDEESKETIYKGSKKFIKPLMIFVTFVLLVIAFYYIEKSNFLKTIPTNEPLLTYENEEIIKRKKEIVALSKTNEGLIKKISDLNNDLSFVTADLDNATTQKAKLETELKESIKRKNSIQEKALLVMKYKSEAENQRTTKKLKEIKANKSKSDKELRKAITLLALREKDIQQSHEKIASLEKMLLIEKASPGIASKEKEELLKKIESLEKNIKKEKATSYYNNGALLSDLGKFQEAVVYYKKAININPELANAHYNLGVIYDKQLNVKEEALKHFEIYFEINPFAPDIEEVKELIKKLTMVVEQ